MFGMPLAGSAILLFRTFPLQASTNIPRFTKNKNKESIDTDGGSMKKPAKLTGKNMSDMKGGLSHEVYTTEPPIAGEWHLRHLEHAELQNITECAEGLPGFIVDPVSGQCLPVE